MLTGEMLAAWCEKALAVGAKYWYGTCWYAAEEELLLRKQKQYPKHYTQGRMSTYRSHIAQKRMVCDCVGLIKGFFWTENGAHENRYRTANCPDTSANGLIALCEETGNMENMPEERGLVLWMNGHVGVYIGGGMAIEARGYKYGVVRTQVKGRGWKKWGRLPEIMLGYGSDAAEKPLPVSPMLKKGMEGEAVKLMQQLLVKWNEKALPKYGADGEFGTETRTWVKNFQKARGIEVDGIVGPVTWGELLEV